MKLPVKCIFVFLAALTIAVLIAGCSSSSDNQTTEENQKPAAGKDTLKVHYINVGQADSILAQLPGGQNILIDAGNNADADLVVNYLRQQGVKQLDHVIGTHPHEDHIGGLDVVIQTFDTGKVYLPRVSHNTKTYEDILLAIKNKDLKVTGAKTGTKLDTVFGVDAVFLAPGKSSYDGLNNYSAVLKLTYVSTSFLFTGDAEAESEQEMLLASWQNPKADVLKVGHHGSDSSTTAAFLAIVSPDYAVISVGKDNDYGHPHAETMAKLVAAGVQVFRTDRQGTIVATSDGKSITFNKKGSPVKERAPGSSPHAAKAPTNVSSSGSVEIIGIDLGREIVTIKNTGGDPVDLSGWKLVSQKGDQVFNFPAETAIATGEALKVKSGPDAQVGSNSLVWTNKNIWNNNGDPGALYDSDGKLVSRFPR
ncbi:MAG: MBL fold metallo-hydrolase [Firmicutes bacterium]|nr:MBL fold metallo-hydrolase [Bacillota bacterium]